MVVGELGEDRVSWPSRVVYSRSPRRTTNPVTSKLAAPTTYSPPHRERPWARKHQPWYEQRADQFGSSAETSGCSCHSLVPGRGDLRASPRRPRSQWVGSTEWDREFESGLLQRRASAASSAGGAAVGRSNLSHGTNIRNPQTLLCTYGLDKVVVAPTTGANMDHRRPAKPRRRAERWLADLGDYPGAPWFPMLLPNPSRT
jgi:hypothetical protein